MSEGQQKMEDQEADIADVARAYMDLKSRKNPGTEGMGQVDSKMLSMMPAKSSSSSEGAGVKREIKMEDDGRGAANHDDEGRRRDYRDDDEDGDRRRRRRDDRDRSRERDRDRERRRKSP